jgi:hypothetical protein
MGLPRKAGICDQRATEQPKPCLDDYYILRDNRLLIQDTEDDQFVKLVEAFQRLNKPASTSELVSSHHLFPRVMEEYMSLCNELLLQAGGRSAPAVHAHLMARAHNEEDKQ